MAELSARAKTVRRWLRITALLFAALFILSQCVLSKPKAQNTILSACIDNTPFDPRWAEQLAAAGLAGQENTAAEPYCHCMWDDTLAAMNAKQIRDFSKMSVEQQLDALGGEQALTTKHEGCLKKMKESS